MATQQPNRDIIHKVITIYKDAGGTEFHRSEYVEETLRAPNGSLISQKTGENSILAGGELHNPAMSSGNNPQLPVGVCLICMTAKSILPWRPKPAIRLANLNTLTYCYACGKLACARCRRQSRHDHQWRCRRCHSKHMFRSWIKGILLCIFFKEVK